ncbi:transporter, major facilitator family protein [Corynebacterium efficiens YS-314]|uniref:Putative transport protein n=1 Tax=Corynebacterium efficiens (strain DSM 44549 / YS-314 / AJ 12310 / JCM 11189 / NBRC 100395) TaxID=196164 RepID=Q8FLK6_COREF|nr:aromatic acid/H+ symport family MFS transporter [Corynebacterium efficiens]EEW48566.1 transporter, major facilitator family protein [Corynebacterium efficiens YS-314]BAC19672.1 putative transport protein [Corynebacterium efficiens YS-314]
MTSHATENGGAPRGGSGPATAGVETLESKQHSFTILGIGGRRLAAVLLGWFFVVFDGYDLIVYGTVQSALANEWGLGSAQLGTIGSMAFFGMAIGAVFIGRLSDRLGRKAAVIGSVVILSLFTFLCTFAPNPWVFGAFRFVAGLGLGGLVPSVNAMVSDLVPRRTMSAWATVMMSGVPLGGSIAAVLAGPIVTSSEEWGWRIMFLLALIPLVVGLPLALKVIPSDDAIRADHIAREGAEESASFKDLLNSRFRWVSIWFAVATFFTLLAWYGLGTWLPRLMEQAGYNFGAALMFTLALNLGAIIGSVVTAWAGDRFGPIRSGAIAAGIAGIALFTLLLYPPVWAVYIILILAGVGTHGTQILIIAAVANFYPSNLRGTALGWSLGLGRIGAVAAPQLAGLLLAWNLGVDSNFIMFAAAAVFSALSLAILLRLQKKFSVRHQVVVQG